jgi:phosphohistidine swiveling domain-containing protein
MQATMTETENTLCLSLNAPGATLAATGGKGLNLTKLAQAGFPVPGGFIVTTDGYEAFVTGAGLAGWMASEVAAIDAGDPESLNALSGRIRARFRESEMPAELAEAICSAYAEMGQPKVAVRSSATAEDLPDFSFAGQQDTFLNVLGDDGLLDAVRECWSSLWTARAIGYRARNGIDQSAVSLAVVVEEMVQSDTSGVLFTANPLTGRRTETVIDAIYGLGEALVSGQVEPDHYTVETATGRIVEKQLGAKATVIRGVDGGGTVTESADAHDEQALSDEAIREVTGLGKRVADFYGSPQDIEWGYADGHLYLLQSRAITSLFPVPELPADENTDDLRVYFSFGAVQGMLDPMTPLGRDVIKAIFIGGGTLFGFHGNTPENQKVLYEAGGRLWGNLTPVINNERGRKMYLGTVNGVDPGAASTIKRLVAEPGRLPEPGPLRPETVRRIVRFALPRLAVALSALARPDQNRAEAQQIIDETLARLTAQAQAAADMPEQVQLLEDVAYTAFTVMVPQLMPRILAGMAGLRGLTVLAEKLTEIDPSITGQTAMDVTRGLPHNVTTEMDLSLWIVAQVVRDDPASAAHFAEMDAPTLASEYLAGTLPYPAQAAIAGFMDRYGMRGLAEIDFGRPRWREQPAQVMQMVQNYLRIDDPTMAPDAVFGRGEAAAEATVERLAAAARRSGPLGSLKERLVRGMAYRARALSGLRESPKFMIIRLFGVARTAILAMGETLAGAGVLAQAQDIVFLRISELRRLAATPLDQMDQISWQALIAQRRQAYDRELGRRQVPRVLLSDGTTFYDGYEDSSGEEEVEGVLRGSPVSAGVVEGNVRVVFDPYTAHLLPGEILVCPGTDPAWTPLFLSAGGLVMEVGGLMTHGSVVAREYGIPAVVGVDRATERLQSGMRIRVDGSSGRVEILE